MAELRHIGPALPFCGEQWSCSACGAEFEIPEDHDLPDTCPECGAVFGESQSPSNGFVNHIRARFERVD